VWQQSVDLTELIYRETENFPPREQFGITSQLRRAAVSVISNIAEGQGRATRGEWLQFLGHARGSLYEIESQLIVAARLGFLPEDRLRDLLVHSSEIGRSLSHFMNWVGSGKRKHRPPTTDHRPR
jgi:four helix bundle protein